MEERERKYWGIGIWVALIAVSLYAPFELSRILIKTALSPSHTMVWKAPWYWVAELIATWVGYLFITLAVIRVSKLIKDVTK